MGDASPSAGASPSGGDRARVIRETLERIRSAERAQQESESERRRGQRDATRALARVLQLDSADGERLARHAGGWHWHVEVAIGYLPAAI